MADADESADAAKAAARGPDAAITAMRGIFQAQQQAFQNDGPPDEKSRIMHLEKLKGALIQNRERLCGAVDADFGGRSREETRMAELLPSVEGIRHAKRRIRRWMKPRRRRMHPLFLPGSARVVYQPAGVAGIVVPWNYPIYLAAAPLVGALAAGNRVMIKMSEYTPRTAEAFREILANAFRADHVAVITGEADVAAAFSGLPWDHLLFTGSTAVGRHVLKAAAGNLTPVTLELGGKSPAIIGPDAAVADAAARIAFGKLVNAGQTCIAPDYVLCPRQRLDAFAESFQRHVAAMYPRMVENPDYTSIINSRHHGRLAALIADAAEKGAKVDIINPAGEDFSSTRKMPVHLVRDVNADMRVMQEEIFGPVLPVAAHDGLADAVARITGPPHPLALYYFGHDRRQIRQVLRMTRSGGVVVNDTLIHAALEDLPFGGVGASGMGRYHGREGFETFSNPRGVVRRPRLNSMKLVYPPYGRLVHRLIDRVFLR
jgi:coniferyl-aldehyde dehydrogenase